MAEKDASSIPPESAKPTSEEALNRLEDHRCAICQNILIKACRIDCGHTFCYHCLNIDKENRNERGKSTCFICDAAITEISRNSERDKEIDGLYAVLSIDERLSRARAKSERKAEEESFTSRPRENSSANQNSNESVASGDASFNRSDSERATWMDPDDNRGSDTERDDAPIFYCRPYAFWADDQEDIIGHECQTESECQDTGEDNADGDGSNTECSGAEDDTVEVRNSPFPQPIVIHHTVQHIYHTLEVHDRDDGRDNRSDRRQSRSPTPPEWRGPEQAYLPRYREQLSPRRPTLYQEYSFPSHYRSPTPTYSSAGYYHHYHHNPVPHSSALPTCTYSTSPYFAHSEGYHHPSRSYNSERYQPERYIMHHYESAEEDDRNNSCACERLCEYHRTMHDRDLSVTYESCRSGRSHSHECLSRRSSHGRIPLDPDTDNEGEDENYYYNPLQDEPDVISFNVTIPMTLTQNISRRRDSFEGRPSTRNDFVGPGETQMVRREM